MPRKKHVIDIAFRHALIGTWIHPDEAHVEYTVSSIGDVCEVSGIDKSDGERFVITNVVWDGRELKFNSLCPSSQHRLKHTFRVISDTEVEHEWTCVESWFKMKNPSR